MNKILPLLLFLVAGCGITSEGVDIYQSQAMLPRNVSVDNSTPLIHCQTISNVHVFTAVAGLICWDRDGKPVQPANSSVQAEVPASVLQSTIQTGATVAGPLLYPANKNVTNVTK